jgi:hypothetical protein
MVFIKKFFLLKKYFYEFFKLPLSTTFTNKLYLHNIRNQSFIIFYLKIDPNIENKQKFTLKKSL